MRINNHILLKPIIFVGGVLLLGGCRTSDDKIETYRLAKEPAPLLAPMASPHHTPVMETPMNGAMQPLPGMAPAANAKDISWKTPKEWSEQAPSSMRVGSFLVTGPDNQQADVSIIPLSGSAGGDLANINRWRDQIDLPPLNEGALTQHVREVKLPAGLFHLVDFTSEKPLIARKYRKRVLAASLQQGDRTWFFKMMGEGRTVEQSKQKFMDFLSTVRLRE